MPDRTLPAVRARFLGTTVDFHCAHPRDAGHLRYYLDDHLVPERTFGEAELSVRLEADGDGCLTAALGTATPKRVWWRTPGGPWLLYEEWGVQAPSWAVRVHRDELVEFQVDGTEGSAVAGLRSCR
ncbi:hypothetical protein AB0F45_38065, partial [Streptomyces achromogenes]